MAGKATAFRWTGGVLGACCRSWSLVGGLFEACRAQYVPVRASCCLTFGARSNGQAGPLLSWKVTRTRKTRFGRESCEARPLCRLGSRRPSRTLFCRWAHRGYPAVATNRPSLRAGLVFDAAPATACGHNPTVVAQNTRILSLIPACPQFLQRDPAKRLCDPDKIKGHAFFDGVEWVLPLLGPPSHQLVL